MESATFREQINRQLDQLTPDQQRQVLDFTISLGESDDKLPVGTSGDILLKFVGSISKDDLELMERAISDCDTVDPDGW
jgi:hypothetical protein